MSNHNRNVNQDNFFARSDSDALRDYEYSCESQRGPSWDWIVLTAAGEHQAAAYRLQIEKRRREHRLPRGSQFLVVPDFEDKRIGSGGATLNVLRVLTECMPMSRLAAQKILIIHSGGDSKRIPQYSACGKLFAPVPRQLPGGFVSTLFDELLISAASIPNRSGCGILILPSDTKLLFNALQIDLLSCEAAGLSMKAPVSVGQEHGVFVQNENLADHRNNNVSLFLHKQPESVLRRYGAVDVSNQVNVDTGCIWFGKSIVQSLISLITTDGRIDMEKFVRFVNPTVCLNFYADFVYPLAENSTWESYEKEAPENSFSEALLQCRREIWEQLHSFRMSLVKLVPARYIHFGMTHEMYELFVKNIQDYAYLGWQKRISTNAVSGCVINSIIGEQVSVPESVYIEDSRLENVVIGEGSILSGIEACDCTIPENVVLHGLKLTTGEYVCRIYGREDNPKSSKEAPFLQGTLAELTELTGISKMELWGGNPASIWNARIYPVCEGIQDAVKSSLALYDILGGRADKSQIGKWLNSKRLSLAESFLISDVESIMNSQSQIRREVQIARFVSDMQSGRSMREAIRELIQTVDDREACMDGIIREAGKREFPDSMRLYLAASEMSRMMGEKSRVDSEMLEDEAYGKIKLCIAKETYQRFGIRQVDAVHFVENEVRKALPVRVNFCGSPSDAAPYCLEHGGTMIDGTLLLKGQYPIQVIVRRLNENVFRFSSLDQGRSDVYEDIEAIRDCGNPGDAYALHKAVIVATGLVSRDDNGETLLSLCEKIGGGLELLTSVDVPKGSGLGTSSILAAAALLAVNQILGIAVTDEMIYAQVFLVEQLMNTGGGWQDQVGGLTPGIKYFTSQPGRYQKIEIERLALSEATRNELNERFALIFSGQRRLARNVLREEMNQCIRNEEVALNAIQEIQECCAIMRFYLLRGDVTTFARYITKQFELVKTIDAGASNTCIEYIFEVCRDLLDGWSICGAGGGGFLQVILKRGVTRAMLQERIVENFIDCGVEVWDSTFI